MLDDIVEVHAREVVIRLIEVSHLRAWEKAVPAPPKRRFFRNTDSRE
jgi:hypothetical protein